MGQDNTAYLLPEQRGWGSTPWGAALGEFGDYMLEQLPQTPEDVALDLSPLGKAIGLIPPKLIRHYVDRIRRVVSREPFTPDQQRIIQQQIDMNPRVAAHMSTILPDAKGLSERNSLGSYTQMRRGAGVLPNDVYWKANAAMPFDTVLAKGGTIRLHEYQNPLEFESSLRHEFNHGAQDMMGKLPELSEWTSETPYLSRPQEIGSRVSQDRLDWVKQEAGLHGMSVAEWKKAHAAGKAPKMLSTFDTNKAIENQVNLAEQKSILLPYSQQAEHNNALLYLNEELKKRGKRLNIVRPPTGTMEARMPYRVFTIEDVILPPR